MAGVSLRLADGGSDASIAGFALLRAVADEAELLLIAVDPAVQKGKASVRRWSNDFVELRHRAAAHGACTSKCATATPPSFFTNAPASISLGVAAIIIADLTATSAMR